MMTAIPVNFDYPTETSRLAFNPGCYKHFDRTLFDRQLRILRILARQARWLGLFDDYHEFNLLIAAHLNNRPASEYAGNRGMTTK